MFRGRFDTAVATALNGRDLGCLQVVAHAFFNSPNSISILSNAARQSVILSLNFCFSDVRETLAFLFSALLHVPHYAASATAWAKECVVVDEKLLLCHAAVFLLYYSVNDISEQGNKLSLKLRAISGKSVFATSHETDHTDYTAQKVN